MNHLNIGELPKQKTHEELLKQASSMIGVDISKPIDVSQMQIRQISCEPVSRDNDYGRMFLRREVRLSSKVINEFGEEEEIFIEFVIHSNRRPKGV